MPLTDSYGQNVKYPTLTDKPNAQTLGQQIVEGLTPKVVMLFASAVVRGGTVLKPTAGMVTWLHDVGRLEVYNGTAWSRLSPQSAAGSLSVSFTNESSYVQWVAFSKPFASAPTVTVNINSPAGVTARWHARAYGITGAGFNLFLFASDNGGLEKATWSNVAVCWQALAHHGTTN